MMSTPKHSPTCHTSRKHFYLLRRHPPEAVITFLKELHKDYGKSLSQLIQDDKTNSRINELVAKRFRIKMAINTIRNHDKDMEAA